MQSLSSAPTAPFLLSNDFGSLAPITIAFPLLDKSRGMAGRHDVLGLRAVQFVYRRSLLVTVEALVSRAIDPTLALRLLHLWVAKLCCFLRV